MVFEANQKNLTPVALAILFREGRFLMQLRDNIPNIAYPGHWGLFGGHLESEETPEIGLERELFEEINFIPETFAPFRSFADERIFRYVYYARLSVPVEKLILNEGWDLDLLGLDDIRRGNLYSHQAQASKPLGAIHQKILLDFLATGIDYS